MQKVKDVVVPTALEMVEDPGKMKGLEIVLEASTPPLLKVHPVAVKEIKTQQLQVPPVEV